MADTVAREPEECEPVSLMQEYKQTGNIAVRNQLVMHYSYIVKGIVSSWREILEGFPMPQAVEATLIPFGNVIIFDGIITSSSSRVCLSRNMSEQSKQIYLNAKKNGKLHYCL